MSDIKYFVDRNGGLMNILADSAPHLNTIVRQLPEDQKMQLEELHQLVSSVHNYLGYHYALPMENSEEESWHMYVKGVTDQIGLAQKIEKLQHLRCSAKLGDRVVVVQSDRPFFESIPLGKNVKQQGEVKGYIGTLVSQQLTNVKYSNLYSLDGKIYQRIELTAAHQLSSKEIIEWAGANITWNYYHVRDPLDNWCKQANRSTNAGSESTVIYSPFPFVDYLELQ